MGNMEGDIEATNGPFKLKTSPKLRSFLTYAPIMTAQMEVDLFLGFVALFTYDEPPQLRVVRALFKLYDWFTTLFESSS